MSKAYLTEQDNAMAGTPIRVMYENATGIDGKPKKKIKLVGTAIVCETAGINGRVYRASTMAREANKFNTHYIPNGLALGEANHPPVNPDGSPVLYPVTDINMDRACHYIEKVWMEGNLMKMKSRIVETVPMGATIKGFLDDGIPLFVSLRGLGDVSRIGGKNVVNDDYTLITIDIVGRPSYGVNAKMDSVVESIKSNKIPLTESVEAEIITFMKEVDRRSNNTKTSLNESVIMGNLFRAMRTF